METAALAFAEEGEDQTEIFLRRPAANFYFLGKAVVFGRLLDALAGAVVFPAMVETADAIVLDPADRQLRAPMGAAEIDNVRRAARAAIKRKAFRS